MDDYHRGQIDFLNEIFTETRKTDKKIDALLDVLEKKQKELSKIL